MAVSGSDRANCKRRCWSSTWSVYLCGGLTTLVTSPLIGRLADRYGKLRVFRPVALFAILPTLLITNLPPVSLGLSLVVSTFYMMATSGRMVPATALVMACVRSKDRGSFLSINASVQHLAAGLGTQAAALIVGGGRSRRLFRGGPGRGRLHVGEHPLGGQTATCTGRPGGAR